MEFGTDARRKRAAAYKEELDSWEDSERLKLRDFWVSLKQLNEDTMDAAVGMNPHFWDFRKDQHRLTVAIAANRATGSQHVQVTR